MKDRIIPADAGSTQRQRVLLPQTRDHPRGCGEHSLSFARRHSSVGSSPRMRGALVHRQRIKLFPGIIPADAGSTVLPYSHALFKKDHPRGCGEHEAKLHRPLRGHGIIPADAGSTAGMNAPCILQ